MCWMCENPGSTAQDYLDELRAIVLRCGWAVQYVESARTPYAYTIGLTERALPELLVTGLPPQRAARLLNSVAERVLGDGESLSPGKQFTLRAGPLVEVVKVEHPDAHMNAAVAFYGGELRALQLVWADRRGWWPWVAGFDDGRGRQPVLGVRATSD